MNFIETKKLATAQAESQKSAKYMLFSANTNKAGFSQSARGEAASLSDSLKKIALLLFGRPTHFSLAYPSKCSPQTCYSTWVN